MTSTGKKRAELKRLSATVKQSIFDMLALAADILTDREYVDQFGSEADCMDDMENNEFSHFGGSPKLGVMLTAYRAFPDVRKWREHNFNVRVMIDLANPREPKESNRVDWKSRAADLEAELALAKAQLEEQSKTISELRTRLDESLRSLGEKDGTIKVLEKYAPRAAA